MPAYLLVVARVTDRARLAAYNQALADSNLYARHGGFYRFLGPPADDLEAWTGHVCVCAEFPDLASARAFWHSDDYQRDVKPLRAGAGEFHVALFDGAPPMPGQAPRA